MAKTRGVAMHKPVETPDVEASFPDDDTVRTDDETTEDEILAELHKTEDDHSYVLFASRVLGPSRQGFSEPELFKGDAKIILPTLYDELRKCTKHGQIGNYRIRIHRDGKFWRKFDVAVERPPLELEPPKEKSSDLAAVLAAVQASNDRMFQMLERMSQPHAAAPVDMFAGFERLSTIIKNLTPVPLPPPPTPADNSMAILQGFKEGIELARTVGEGGRETGVFDLVDSLLKSPVIARVFDAIASQALPHAPPAPAITHAPQPAPAQPAAPAPAPAQPAAPAQMTVAQILAMFAQNPTMQAQAKQACDYLVSLAQRDGDIETYAFWVCDNWDRRFIDLLLQQPQWFDLVCAVSPEARGFQPWFVRLVAEIREIVNDADATRTANGDARRHSPNGVDGDTGRESGDTGDAEMDGEPS